MWLGVEEDGQISALEADHKERSVSESCIDADLDAIDCALKTVNALWDKYSAKVCFSFFALEFISFA